MGNGLCAMLRFEASQELNLGSGCSLRLGVRSEGKEGARQQLPWLNSPQLRLLGVCCALCSSPAPGDTSRAALSLWRGVTPGAHPPAGIPGAAVAGREPSPFQLRVFRDLPQKTAPKGQNRHSSAQNPALSVPPPLSLWAASPASTWVALQPQGCCW